MKILKFIVLGLTLIVSDTLGQKKIIDVEICNNWERLKDLNGKACLLSANRDYILFKKVSESNGETTILKNLNSDIEKSFIGANSELSFNNDHSFAFRLGGDSLVIFDTQKNKYTYIPGVRDYFIIPSGKEDRLGYLTDKEGKKSLIICDLNGSPVKEFVNVYDYWLHKNGKGLLTKGASDLSYINMSTFKQSVLAKDAKIESAAFSASGNEVVYLSKVTNGCRLHYANFLTGETKILLDSSSDFLQSKWILEPYGLSFDNEEGNVFFKISKDKNYFARQSASVVTKDINVWSYLDIFLQDRQMQALKEHFTYLSMINIKIGKPIHLESDSLKLELFGNPGKYSVLTTPVNENEFYWNKERKKMYLFSSSTGKSKLIKESGSPGFNLVGISPNNKFLVWFDGKDGNYYSYDIECQYVTDISRSVNNSFRALSQRAEEAGLVTSANPQSGNYWIANGNALIVYSKNDIWRLDLTGKKKPINLTNGFGERKNIKFRILESGNSRFNIPIEPKRNEIMVWAFSNVTKQNGFWKISIAKSADPVKILMSDDAYYFSPTSILFSVNTAENPTSFKPIKAAGKDFFVIRKMNSFKSPNLYITRDFKSFKQISNIKAEAQYVGIKSKLVRYILPNGHQAEGILHLPADLDTAKKYPVIFNYYERRSEGLNLYRTPEISGHSINIPWYVSRGYLVFEPDFYYKRGETAQSVIDGVSAAVVELAKLPYVDTARMGAQGHSFGGYESYVLAIQTSFFKAVCGMAGMTNLISEHGSIRPGGHNNQNAAERGQRNLGVFPWDQPGVFIKNSPNFHVRNANTPLLIVHNKEDGSILFSQALELYLGMRRIGKKVWLLEYDREDHDIVESRNKFDYTIRMQQFFDHYLKGEPAPKWMTRGIPASMKGIDSGLELDTEIKTPGEGIARPVEKGKIF